MNKYTLILLAMSFATAGFSQTEDQNGDPLNMDLTFVGDLELFIRDANKLNSEPKVKDSDEELPPIRYTLIPNKLDAEFELKPIEAAKVNVEDKLRKLYKGFVRGGFGLYTTPLLELYYTDGRSRKGTYGFHGKHISTSGGVAVDDSIPDSYSHNSIGLWGKRFVEKFALTGGFNWDRQVINYYGFLPDSFPNVDTDDLKQRFNLFEMNAGIVSYHRDSSKINFDFGVNFYNFTNLDEGSENNFDLDGDLRKQVNNEIYKLRLGFNYNKFDFKYANDNTKGSQSNGILRIEPSAFTTRDNLQVSVGMSIMIDTNGEQPVHFYPVAQASYGLFGDILVPYVGVRGEVVRQTYRDLAEVNPFLIQEPELNSMNNKLELYGGIRGRLSSSASFNAKIASNSYEDFAYFVNDTVYSSTNQFTVVYDDLNVLNLGGELSLQGNEKLSLYLKGDYFIYTTKTETEAWHQPATRFSLGAVYNLRDKLIFRAEAYQMGKRKVLSYGPVQDGTLRDDGSYVRELKGFVDMNLSAEYRYTKRLSVFARMNNFLAARYAMWNNYNLQRFNAMMGATFAF